VQTAPLQPAQPRLDRHGQPYACRPTAASWAPHHSS